MLTQEIFLSIKEYSTKLYTFHFINYNDRNLKNMQLILL